MVALEALSEIQEVPSRQNHLRLVTSSYSTAGYRVGDNLADRRAKRARILRRRRQVAASLVLSVVGTFLLLSSAPAAPSGTAVLSASSALSAGQTYVVQGGESLSSIAKLVNPEHPSIAFNVLERQIGSSVVVPGEHLQIP